MARSLAGNGHRGPRPRDRRWAEGEGSAPDARRDRGGPASAPGGSLEAVGGRPSPTVLTGSRPMEALEGVFAAEIIEFYVGNPVRERFSQTGFCAKKRSPSSSTTTMRWVSGSIGAGSACSDARSGGGGRALGDHPSTSRAKNSGSPPPPRGGDRSGGQPSPRPCRPQRSSCGDQPAEPAPDRRPPTELLPLAGPRRWSPRARAG